MAQLSRIGKHATTIRNENGKRIVRYHYTDIVTVDKDQVRLNAGGWHTATTKTRMNQAANEWGLGFSVFQRDYAWFVEFGGHVWEFLSGMTLHANGQVEYPGDTHQAVNGGMVE